MKQIGREYYDTQRKFNIPQYKLDLINGFATSIANYENRLLLCAEITHKLLHSMTIYDVMNDLWRAANNNQGGFREKCTVEIVGKTIMTKYNEKTYKIDDINWDANPQSTFETKTGPVSFIDYYRKQYEITIKDPVQPLLVSLPSEKDKRRGQTGPILLVPELACITGVSEEMKSDFRFKKALDVYTKISAKDRCQRLSTFVDTFNRT